MNKKIKLLCTLIALCLMLFLSACGNEGEKQVKKAEESGFNEKAKELDKKTKDSDEKAEDSEQKSKSKAELEKKEKDTKDKEEDDSEKKIVEINEKIFIQKINDIYFNFEDYKDATIIIEGMFSHFQNINGSEERPVVYREGPGCCGNDGWGGFFLLYDGSYPNENDWIRVTGKPKVVQTEGGWLELFLEVEEIEVKKERGAEYVTH